MFLQEESKLSRSYLYIPAIREKLQNDIAAFEGAIQQATNWQLPIRINLADLHKALDNSRALLTELDEKGQPMVDRMIEAGIVERHI
jgi:hypothetical protein